MDFGESVGDRKAYRIKYQSNREDKEAWGQRWCRNSILPLQGEMIEERMFVECASTRFVGSGRSVCLTGSKSKSWASKFLPDDVVLMSGEMRRGGLERLWQDNFEFTPASPWQRSD